MTPEMTCLVIACAASDVEQIVALVAFVELAGVQEEDGCLRLWLADERDLSGVCERLRGWRPVVERAGHGNWNQRWQNDWKPIEVGERFYLVPPGDGSLVPHGRLRLEMHPGTAFGNGDHPATHLCLMAMERHLRPGHSFLDIGCGSGLLGEAARALGAGRVWGCDLDPAVVRPPDAFVGSVDAVRSAICDFVAANIQLGVLESLMPDIVRVMRAGGRVVFSGVLEDQLDALRFAASAAGLRVGKASAESGWAALTAMRS